MSLAYRRHLEENGESAVSPEEFTRIRCGIDPLTGDETVGARQSDAPSTDVNRIVQAFDRDGVLTHLSERVPVFVDASGIQDFRSAMNAVAAGTQFFESLPAKLREEFHNDPVRMMDELAEPEKYREKLERLELIPKVVVPVVPVVEAVKP